MKLSAYIDESGRHDKTGQKEGSAQIVVGGWVNRSDRWDEFCSKWQAVLKKYDVPYFHFYQWCEACAVARKKRQPSSSYKKNPYQRLTFQRLNSLLFELAEIAGRPDKIIVGSFVPTKDFHAAKTHPDYQHFPRSHDDPYHACLHDFFKNLSTEIKEQRPEWGTEPATIFFDQNDDADWNHAVQNAFIAAKENNPNIAELAFADKKIFPNFPLQAADMLAYRFRQIVGKFTDPDALPNPNRLDDLLIKPSMLASNPESVMSMMAGAAAMMPLRYSNFPWRKKINPQTT